MKKYIATIIIAFSFLQGFSQSAGNDTTQYIYYRYTYGNKLDRYWAPKVQMIPNDTTYSKDGIALRAGVFYVGNGVKWSQVTGGGGGGGSTVDSIRRRNDSIFLYQNGGAGVYSFSAKFYDSITMMTRYRGDTANARQDAQIVSAGAQSLTPTQNPTNYNIAISGGNNINLLPGTTNLAGLIDTARIRFLDSARLGLLNDTLNHANGIKLAIVGRTTTIDGDSLLQEKDSATAYATPKRVKDSVALIRTIKLDSVRRAPGSTQVIGWYNGSQVFQYTDSVGTGIVNLGATNRWSTGFFSGRPASPIAGDYYTSKDSAQIDYYDGAIWITVAKTSTSGQALLRTVYVTNYGAKGDATNFIASMTSGTATVTSTTSIFSAPDVGKYIEIGGAGTGGALLRTKISGYTSPTVVTVANNASTSVSSQKSKFGTDNTIPIQNAIYGTWNGTAYNGVVMFPTSGKGYLVCDSVRTVDRDGYSVNNAQIFIPNSESVYTNPKNVGTVILRGEVAPNKYSNYNASITTVPDQMNMIISTCDSCTLLGSSYINIGNICVVGVPVYINHTNTIIENLGIRTQASNGNTPLSGKATAIDFSYVGMAEFTNLVLDNDVVTGVLPQPDTLKSWGIKLMGDCNWGVQYVNGVTIKNYGNGLTGPEHMVMTDAYINSCYNGIVIDTGQHSVHIDKLLIQACHNNIKIRGKSFFQFDHIDMENDFFTGTIAWMTNVYDLYEPVATNSHGSIKYHIVGPDYVTPETNMWKNSPLVSRFIELEKVGGDSARVVTGKQILLGTSVTQATPSTALVSLGSKLGMSINVFESGTNIFGLGMAAGEMQTYFGASGALTWNAGSGGIQPSGTNEKMRLSNVGNLTVVGLITGATLAGRFATNTAFSSSAFTAQAPIDFGTVNAGVNPDLYWYNGGATNRHGAGIQAFETQFFQPTNAHYSWNKGGDFQTSGTNELMRLDATTNALRLGMIADSAALLQIKAGSSTQAQVFFAGMTVDPTSPKNGQGWFNSTTDAFNFRHNGVTTNILAGGSSAPFSTATAIMKDATDATKLLKFDLSGFTTATTRTWIFPDVNGTVARKDAAQTFTGPQTFSSPPVLNSVLTNVGGTALMHNADSSVGQMPLEYGTYAPTLTAISNISGFSGVASTFTRIGNCVHVRVSGTATIVTALTATSFSVPLPRNIVVGSTTQLGAGNGQLGDAGNAKSGIIGDIISSSTTITFNLQSGAVNSGVGFTVEFDYFM